MYTRIIDFGKGMNDQVCSPLNPSNPLNYCIFPTLSSQFTHGSASSGLLYDTNNINCMSFMSERCKDEWDGFCSGYQELNVDTYWPNAAVIDTAAFELAQFFIKKKNTVGENVLRNACQRRFISYPGVQPSLQPFDFNTANSPPIAIYPNLITTSSVLQNLENPDHDQHVLLMLQNPSVCFDVLARIYLGWLRKETSTRYLKNSLLEKYFKSENAIFDAFLEIALPRLQSFQPNREYLKCPSC